MARAPGQARRCLICAGEAPLAAGRQLHTGQARQLNLGQHVNEFHSMPGKALTQPQFTSTGRGPGLGEQGATFCRRKSCSHYLFARVLSWNRQCFAFLSHTHGTGREGCVLPGANFCMHMEGCADVSVHICVCLPVGTCTSLGGFCCMSARTCVCGYICVHVCSCMFVHMHAHRDVST